MLHNQNHTETLMKLDQLLTTLNGIGAKLTEAKTEILQKIADLTNANPDLPGDVVAALESIGASANSLADIVPDVPAPPAESPAEEPAPETTIEPAPTE